VFQLDTQVIILASKEYLVVPMSLNKDIEDYIELKVEKSV